MAPMATLAAPPAVEAVALSKTYRLYATPGARLAEMIFRRPRHLAFPALDRVSFSLPRGESLALIGENGAGKSTLLKLVAGVARPSAGRIVVTGRVAAILELGSGFHPDFTGRQNIELNAALLGLSEDEVRRRTPEIVEWSELGEFIDRPVRQYSSGMAMRLGFAIATQVDPDVLIIDEALSVGDGYFQKKCMDRILAFVEQGRTLLFCSHAMYYVSAFCPRALWLREGRLEQLGATDSVVRSYERYLLSKNGAASSGALTGPAEAPRERAGPARLLAVRQLDASGDRPAYRSGEPWELEVAWESEDPALGFHVAVGINRAEDGLPVASFATHYSGLAPISGRDRYHLRLALPALPLAKGDFSLAVFLLDEQGLHVHDGRHVPDAFAVVSPRFVPGLVEIEHAWRLP
jgi:lipopolysaccharide transport system ATP-binding protein